METKRAGLPLGIAGSAFGAAPAVAGAADASGAGFIDPFEVGPSQVRRSGGVDGVKRVELNRPAAGRRVIAVIATALGAFALMPAAAGAATFTVTKTTDTADGTCDADCSLREAVGAANATLDEVDTIVLPGSGPYTLGIAGADEDLNATGDLDVAGEGRVKVMGAGAVSATVDAAGIDRAFDLDGSQLELRNVRVTGGDVSAAAERSGGGVRVVGGQAYLRLRNSVFEGNTAPRGGAISVLGTGDPRVIADLTTFRMNTAAGAHEVGANCAGTSSPCGGAIFAYDDARVDAIDSRFESNSSAGRAGAILAANPFVAGDRGARIVLRDTTMTANTAVEDGGTMLIQNISMLDMSGVLIEGSESGDDGGAAMIQNHAFASIAESAIRDSTATERGGALFIQNDTQVAIDRSTISGNTAGSRGGGIAQNNTSVLAVTESAITANESLGTLAMSPANGGGGLHLPNSSTLRLIRSTVSGNSSSANGGGIGTNSFSTPNLTAIELTNSTLSGNQAADDGGGIYANEGHDVSIESSTIADNSAAGAGGGIADATGAASRLEVSRSIVAANTAPAGPGCTGSPVSLGFNLDSGSSCGFGAAGDLANSSAGLAALAANGGPTQTHALIAASAAIDAAGAGCPRSTDQRGVARPLGQGCDIGAFERVPDQVVVPEPQPEPEPEDTTPPALELRAKKGQQAKRKLKVTVSCDEACELTLGGKLIVLRPAAKPSKKGNRKRKRFGLKKKGISLTAGQVRKVRLKPGKKAARRLKRALKPRRAKARAKIKGSATDAAGNVATAKLTIKLKR